MGVGFVLEYKVLFLFLRAVKPNPKKSLDVKSFCFNPNSNSNSKWSHSSANFLLVILTTGK